MLQNYDNENEHSQIEDKEKCLICRNLFLKVELKNHQASCTNNLSKDDQEYLDEQLAQLIIDQNFQSTIFSNKSKHQSQQQQKIQPPLQEQQKEYVINHLQIKQQESNEISKERLESKKINEKQIDQQQKDELHIKFPKIQYPDYLFKKQEEDLQKQNSELKKKENQKNDQQIKDESQQYLKQELKQQDQYDLQNNLQNEQPKLMQIKQNLPLNLEIQQNQNQFEKKDQIDNSIQKINQFEQKHIYNFQEKTDPQKNQFQDQEVKVDVKVNSTKEKSNNEKEGVNDKLQYQCPLRQRPTNYLQDRYIPYYRLANIPQNIIRNPYNYNQAQQQQQQQQQQQNDQNQRNFINKYPINNNHQFQQQNQIKKFEFKPGMRLTDWEVNQLSPEEFYEHFTQLDLDQQVGYQSKIFKLDKKRVQINQTGNCAICMDDIQPSKEVKDIQLDCSHQFHFDCIKQWLQKQKNCPLCKEYVDLCLI
ncbi:unnamed protein product [Paramecium primaurelia]|uniref:RING-type domain-containing protein n=1 Tax=Paramecium primaurelia TaxID=5886 RepID=A0A8S1KVU4_PARPR|nr:unnamed protein product [Paramecium primaurelia]